MKRTAINLILDSWTSRPFRIGLVLLCMVCPLCDWPGGPGPVAAAARSATSQSSSKSAKEIEYEVKAAFIYNFMKFIEWPKESMETQMAEKSMVIGILGDNPFGDAFVPILDKEVHGRKITLVNIPSFATFQQTASDKDGAFARYRAKYKPRIESCDVLFVCASEKAHFEKLTALTPGHGILTISDVPGFARDYGIIGFVKDNNKIRFEINLHIAERERFKIRSQLLALAIKIYQAK